MNIAGKKVLVTGGAGFIGSHLVQLLIRNGAHVRVLVHYNSFNTKGYIDHLSIEEQQAIEVIQGDLKEYQTINQACQNAEIVFHLGALIAIPYSYQQPLDVMHTNIQGTLHVAQAVKDWEIPLLVHTSTSEVYGTARYVPMDENHILQAQSPYSASKIAADKIIESFHCSYHLPVVTVRPFNAYGPRQSLRAVIPTIISQALFQSEIILGNLSATRDFTFVEDTARAFLAAASSTHAIGQVFNAGSEFEVSIGDLAKKVTQIIGRDLPIRIDPERLRPDTSEVDRLFSNSSKAKQVLGWAPQISLEEGLEKTIHWISKHKNTYQTKQYVI
ncbi:SDR family NAD(P)-dependent oxidoreductase [Fodinisporobacter ferrooxydans]|uniref:SDR family NAD(P)-dependent oxidoreductase n=1 Tax=Fodinisporobacter ferrooxydans TaxID=2901836 RepID=A0ABY4CI55_9BACL|nr:SDR family NAD(P)-dependent oxidoreductase [Alicyclobacillaceae bacterium MYW30-H2]